MDKNTAKRLAVDFIKSAYANDIAKHPGARLLNNWDKISECKKGKVTFEEIEAICKAIEGED